MSAYAVVSEPSAVDVLLRYLTRDEARTLTAHLTSPEMANLAWILENLTDAARATHIAELVSIWRSHES